MLLGQAKQLCPDLHTVPYDFEAYKAVSETLYTIVTRFTLAVEAVSCDELYADCTELLTLPNETCSQPKLRDGYWYFEWDLINPLVLGSHLRELVRDQTGGCTASIGFGTTRLLARLATKRAKPDGQWFILGASGGGSNRPHLNSLMHSACPPWEWRHQSDFMDGTDPASATCELTGDDAHWFFNLPIGELPGIGYVLVERLEAAFKVHTCGEVIQSVTRAQLVRLLGAKTGARIHNLCHGRVSCSSDCA
ncbi:unnamed protein product [Echinostoma caproni]|uniref:UmuC domain-containing protein n=1 Tax=Echinostoma caproni TaxID=27848 RepID=A0A183B6Q5_9TREM|nr:unnamed protein product [Echinostoma caproni]